MQKDMADEVHRKFRSTDGDHLTLLNVFKAYKANKCNKVSLLMDSLA
jgi:hypothetical protein